MVVTKFNSKAKVSDTSSLADQMVKTLTSSSAKDEYISIMINMLREKAEEINSAINFSKAESVLEEKDALVDENIRSINHLLNAFELFPDANVKEASLVVSKIFTKAGGAKIVKEPYATQEGIINSLLTDFSSQNVVQAIAKLPGLSSVIDSLKKAQADFVEARLQWITANADATTESATEIKKSIVAIINDLITSHLSVVSEIVPDRFNKLAIEIDAIIVNANK